jgi:hypothetical protein
MLFAFSGFNLVHLDHMNAVAVVSHLPWVLLATRALLRSDLPRRRAAAFAGLALLVASQALLGYPQDVWMTLVAAGCLALWRCRRGTPASRAALLAGAVVCGLLIGGVQLVPTIDARAHSVRAVASREFALIVTALATAALWRSGLTQRRVHAAAALTTD